MDNSVRQRGSDIQQPGGFFPGLHIFDTILNWLARLFQLTEEEQKDAGIYYPGDQRDK